MHFPCPRPARRKKISNLTTSHRASIRLCLCKEKVTQRFISVSLPSNTFDRTDRTSRIRESGETYILFFYTYFGTNERSRHRLIYSFSLMVSISLLSNLGFFSKTTTADSKKRSANRQIIFVPYKRKG